MTVTHTEGTVGVAGKNAGTVTMGQGNPQANTPPKSEGTSAATDHDVLARSRTRITIKGIIELVMLWLICCGGRVTVIVCGLRRFNRSSSEDIEVEVAAMV